MIYYVLNYQLTTNFLQAMEMKAKKTTHKKASTNAGDRESRLREILGASGSAEEALLKQAAHFDLHGNAESAEMASEEMVKVNFYIHRKMLRRRTCTG